MEINRNYMKIVIHKLLEDIKAKEIDYGLNGVKVQILLGRDEAQVLLDALETPQPFINKPCVSEGVCREDKMQVLDKIRADIEQECKVESEHPYGQGLRRALDIIDKYRGESEREE